MSCPYKEPVIQVTKLKKLEPRVLIFNIKAVREDLLIRKIKHTPNKRIVII
jgi:hypothetical protein